MTDTETIDAKIDATIDGTTDTTITVKRTTRNEIAACGKKDTTFDEILKKLVTCWRKTH